MYARFNAQPGTYTLTGTTVARPLDMHFLSVDVGAEFVRPIELDGDLLVLATPPDTRQGRTHVVCRPGSATTK